VRIFVEGIYVSKYSIYPCELETDLLAPGEWEYEVCVEKTQTNQSIKFINWIAMINISFDAISQFRRKYSGNYYSIYSERTNPSGIFGPTPLTIRKH
jgi:hypothetical protein